MNFKIKTKMMILVTLFIAVVVGFSREINQNLNQ